MIFISIFGDIYLKSCYFIWKSSRNNSGLGKYWNTSHFNQFWTWKYWKTSHFDSVSILKLLEIQSFWFSFEPGNTGKPVRMTHNNIILYGNPVRMIRNNIILFGNLVRMIQNWPRILYGQYGPAGGRVGWLKSIGKESILGICILKKTEYCIYIYH